MNISIFTEALQTTGLGHLGRCTALAEILVEKGEKVNIILDTDGIELSVTQEIPIKKYNWKNLNDLINFFYQYSTDIAIVDSYLANIRIFEEIQKRVELLICIDDTNRITYPKASTILNPGLGGQFIQYDINRNKILTGSEYILLRKPFREEFSMADVKEKIGSIFLSVGGSDSLNLIPDMLKILNQDEYSSWKKEVLVGPGFHNIDEIKSLASENTQLHFGLNARQIRELMLSVDIAITAGGQTTYELAKCGVPMIIIKTIENQSGNVQGFLTLGMAVLSYNNELLTDITKNLQKLSSKSLRLEIRNKLLSSFEGKVYPNLFKK